MIELTEIMRQKNDQPFTELLNRFRTGAQTDEDICCIQSRTISSLDSNYPSDALHIWAENIPVDQHNCAKLAQILKPMFTLKATDQYPNNVNKQDIDRVLARGRSETGGLDYELHLKETARVMLTANIDISDRLINGQIGTVVKIYVNPNTQRPSIVFIKFDDDKARQNMINNSNNQYAKEHKVVPIEPILAKIKVRPNKPSSPEIQRIQFPITLAWACTVHKVQGLTMDSIVISFHLNKQRSFNYGQIYVAISCAKTLQGIYTLGKIEHKDVRANPKVHEEYERLRNVAAITMRDQQINQSESPTLLVVSLLNIRSLSKHSIDIKFDSSICNSDFIAFTETQLLPNSNDNQIRENLQPFTLLRQDHVSDRFSSLALCAKNNIAIKECEYFSAINAIKFLLVNHVTDISQSVILLYRKHSSNILDYINVIKDILISYDIELVLGDFNITFFNHDQIKPLKTLMDSLHYIQVVKSPTFVSAGSLLDHVYVKCSHCHTIKCSVLAVYYSDHDAIKISINSTPSISYNN